MTVGERIRERRESMSISQTQLAQAIGCKNKASISRIENDLEKLTLGRLERIANALYVNPAVLAGWTENKQTYSKVEKEVIEKFRRLSADNKKATLSILDIFNGEST